MELENEKGGKMKVVIIAAITVGIMIALVIGTMSYQIQYDQNCTAGNGKVTGFLRCTITYEDFTAFEITGIEYVVSPDEPLLVSVQKIGYDMCDSWEAKIVNVSDNSTVWERDSITSCVVLDPPKQQKFEYKISNENNPIIISDIGNYVFEITIGDTYLEKEFIVRNNTSGPTLDRITESELDRDDPEPSDGIFYPRYHIAIYQNAKTMEQYVTPDFITIGPHSQVTWSNYDDVTISLNSIDPDNTWSTTVISPDGYDTLTFDETGIYEYRGNSGIRGIIVVMDDGGELLSSMFDNVFGLGSPLVYREGLEPVLLYDNCKRYAYWLTEHQKEKIDLPEDYPRYPPWGNQIFPLVDFCITNGDLVKTVDEQIHWEFQLENED